MQTQALFILVSAAIAIVSALFVIWPIFRNTKNQSDNYTNQANAALDVLREQLEQIEQDIDPKNTQQLEEYKQELEQRALEEGIDNTENISQFSNKKFAILILLFVVITAPLGYLFWGEPKALNPIMLAHGDTDMSGFTENDALDDQAVIEMVQGMADRLAANGGTNQEWLMLARSYIVMGKYDKALQAFSSMKDIDDAVILSDWAEAIALENNRVTQESEQMAFKALDVDAENIKSLLLVGTAAYEREDYENAVKHWQKVLDQFDSDEMQLLQDTVDEARSKIK